MIERLVDKFIAYFEPLAFLFVGVITFGLIKFIMTPHTRTLKHLGASLFVSVPMGVLTGAIMKEAGYGEMASTGVACATAILAHDIIMAAILRKRHLVRYLDRAINNIIDKLTK